MKIELPLKTVSLLNMREHWRRAATRKADHRLTTTVMLNGTAKPDLPVVVTFTRNAPGTLDAHDNLPSSMKHICDAVAQWLGIDDSDPRVTWKYAQKRGKAGHYSVTLEITSAP